MNIFNAPELCRIAIQIEENGEQFYRFAANLAQAEPAQKIFRFLADEEVAHKKIFLGILHNLQELPDLESYPGEWQAYLQAYTATIIFSPEQHQKAMARIKNTRAAIQFGIQRELDSILYYQEMKSFLPVSQHGLVDNILAEERKHFLKLSELQQTL